MRTARTTWPPAPDFYRPTTRCMTCGEPILDSGRCPLCGQPNECQLCTAAAYKGPCWCAKVEIPNGLLARVPVELRNRACICRGCVASFQKFAPGLVSPTL
jgi:hypothetical protein